MAGVDDFDGNRALQLDIVSVVNLGHPAPANRPFQPEISQLMT
jgi:hypothetical protein